MSVYLSLDPVAAGVFTALNVAAVTGPGLATGGVSDQEVPEGATYPRVWFELSINDQLGGFGTKPGAGQLDEIDLRVHVLTSGNDEGMKQGYAILAACIGRLADPPTVSGYGSWAIFHDRTVPIGDEVIAGVRVKEVVAIFRLYVEQGK